MKTRNTSTLFKGIKNLMGFGLICAAFLLAAPSQAQVQAQDLQRTVSGVVTSMDGPVFGAAVTLKGTTVGTYTDENGRFTFPKPLTQNDVLVVTYLGYEDAVVTIDQGTTVVEPFLKDNPVILIGALRMGDASLAPDNKTN